MGRKVRQVEGPRERGDRDRREFGKRNVGTEEGRREGEIEKGGEWGRGKTGHGSPACVSVTDAHPEEGRGRAVSTVEVSGP